MQKIKEHEELGDRLKKSEFHSSQTMPMVTGQSS